MNHVKQICTQFCAMQSLQDLYALLNFVCSQKTILKQDFPAKIAPSKLNYCLFNKDVKYNTYLIPKKGQNKPPREIHAPKEALKQIQRILNYCLQAVFEPKKAAHGFVKQRSIVSNASAHVGRPFVLNIDLENFFPSIHFGRVKGIFSKAPFNFNPDLSQMLANLCCYEGKLPQGAPTSPVLSNLVCRSLDFKLVGLANKYKIRYTRYADDITFSSTKNVFEDSVFQQELQGLITKEGFLINQSKVRLQSHKERQTVTGLVVNKKVNITSKFKHELRWMIHLWEKHGQEAAQKWLDDNYQLRHRYNGKVPKIEKVIDGNLSFMKMVVGESSTYLSLKNKTSKLLTNISISTFHGHSIVQKKIKRVPSGLEHLVDNNLWEDSLSRHDVRANFHRDNIEHIPILQAAHIARFRQQIEFRRVVHTEIDDSDTLKEVALQTKTAWEALKSEINQPGVRKKRGVRHEVYMQINNFIVKLNSKVYAHGNESYSTYFNQNAKDFIYPFTRLFRIGVSIHELSISKLLEVANQGLEKDVQIDPADKLTSDFSLRTSSLNLFFALRKILGMTKKHTVKVEAKQIGNRKILQVINLDSNNNSKSIDDQGGDLADLKLILWSLCDVNIIWKTDSHEKYKQKILPAGISTSFNDEVAGFTYELVFPNFPRKALYVDDDTRSNRWKQINHLSDKYHDYLFISDRLPHNWQEDYNWIFIHQNYSESVNGYKIKAEESGIEFWQFSGGLEHSEINLDHRIISFDVLLKTIESFCEYLKKESESFFPEKDQKKLSDFFRKNKIDLIKLKEHILLEKKKHQLTYPELNDYIYLKTKELAEIAGFKVNQVPEKFYGDDGLIEFLDLCISNL